MGFTLTQNMKTAIGFNKQAALQTALSAGSLVRLAHTSGDFAFPKFISDNNRDDFGKGTPFATNTFPNRIDFDWPFNARLTSLNAAIICGFGLGTVVKTAAGSGFQYVCTPINAQTADPDMPSTSICQQLDESSGHAIDILNAGCCVEQFGLSLKNGTGRDTSLITAQFVGSGKHAKPSSITIPSPATEHEMNLGTVTTLSVRSVNYISNKLFVDSEITYKNNIQQDLGFFPGCGSQSGYAIRGRMLRGMPDLTFNMTVFINKDSTELTDYLAQTEGAIQIIQAGDVIGAGPETHKIQIDVPRMKFAAYDVQSVGMYTAVKTSCEVLQPNSGEPITITVVTDHDGIMQAA